LSEIYREIHLSLVYCLEAAVKARELHASADCDELSYFLYAALHGAILQSKIERSPAPLERFKKTLFAVVIRPAPPRSERATRPRASGTQYPT
jgi:TetR/AcrR family transcriptional regulator, transcriptional repressor for nem operon